MQFGLYINAVHRFVLSSPALCSKLPVTKILDIVQSDRSLFYSLFAGAFDLSALTVQKVINESAAITFLLYQFVLSYQNN